ncbi:MAG: hypothetical protein K2F83_04995, partial [Oscillospiraceae bacterium]|nr:hypothetical protein [Oscillospiraceae bacterium]
LLHITDDQITSADPLYNEANKVIKSTRSKAIYYAAQQNDAKYAGAYQGEEMPVSIQLTRSQEMIVDTGSIVEEDWKGYNLHWDVIRRDAETEKEDGKVSDEADYADRFYAFSSDESVIKVFQVRNAEGKSVGIQLVPTHLYNKRNNIKNNSARDGSATIVVVDRTNLYWGSFTVTVFNEGFNDDNDPIVALASVYSGINTSYAIKQNGTVWAWGENRNNNLALTGEFNETAEVDTANPASDFVWKYYEAETSSEPYLTNMINTAQQRADALNNDVADATTKYNDAVAAMNALNWAQARADFMAAVETLRDQVDEAVSTINDTISTLETYMSSGTDITMENLKNALVDLTAALIAKRDVYDEAYTRARAMTGSSITQNNFRELNTSLSNLANNVTGDNGRDADLAKAVAAVVKNETQDVDNLTARDDFENMTTGNSYYGSAVQAVNKVDSLLESTSALQSAITALAQDGTAILTYAEGIDFLDALTKQDTTYTTLRALQNQQDPHLADVAF